MLRRLEILAAALIALGLHGLLLIDPGRPEGGAAAAGGAAGGAGAATVVADAEIAALVERWTAPPEPEPPAKPPAAPDPPDTPEVADAPGPPPEPKEASAPKPEPRPKPVAQTEPKPKPERKPKPRAKLKPRPKPKPSPAARPAEKETKKASETASGALGPRGAAGRSAGRDASGHGREAASGDGRAAASLLRAWGGAIRAEVSRKREYPRVSRRRGDQGRVLITVTVSRGGALQAVVLAKGSGVRRLDQAALDAARRAAPYPKAPEGLQKASYRFTIPVTFQMK